MRISKGIIREVGEKHATGSVCRSLRYRFKMENEPGFAEKIKKRAKDMRIKRLKRINNRCLDCKKLIEPVSKRCMYCAKIYLNKKKNGKFNKDT